MSGSEFEAAAVAGGPGTTSAQVQQSAVLLNLEEIIFGTGQEDQLEGAEVHCDAPP